MRPAAAPGQAALRHVAGGGPAREKRQSLAADGRVKMTIPFVGQESLIYRNSRGRVSCRFRGSSRAARLVSPTTWRMKEPVKRASRRFIRSPLLSARAGEPPRQARDRRFAMRRPRRRDPDLRGARGRPAPRCARASPRPPASTPGGRRSRPPTERLGFAGRREGIACHHRRGAPAVADRPGGGGARLRTLESMVFKALRRLFQPAATPNMVTVHSIAITAPAPCHTRMARLACVVITE